VAIRPIEGVRVRIGLDQFDSVRLSGHGLDIGFSSVKSFQISGYIR
jgi:hypothetical protein